MKTIKHLLLLLITILTFSCEKDDEIVVDNEAFQYQLHLTDTLSYITEPYETVLIPLDATAPEYDLVQVRFKKNGQPFKTSDLEYIGENTWRRGGIAGDSNFDITPNDNISGAITALLVINTIEKPNTELSININWPQDTTPVEYETIEISSIQQSTLSGNTLVTENLFHQNSYNTGQLVTRLFYNGTELGDDINTFVGVNGSTHSTYTHSQIQGNRTYQMLVENTNPDEPTYAFVDSAGDIIVDTNSEPVSSIVLEFTTLEVTAQVESQTPNVGPNSIMINAEVSTNSTLSEDITVKLFPQGSTTEIYSSSVFSTPSGGGNLFINDLLIDGLTSGSHYDLKYFLNTNTTPFATYTLTTLSSGSFSAIFGTINENVNGGEVQIIWGNQSGDDINGFWEFSGTDVQGNNYIYTEPINFNNGLINQSTLQTISGFQQNSFITVRILINDVPYIETSFGTNPITYSNYQNIGLDDTSNPIELNPGEGNINRSKITFSSNGIGTITTVIFRLINNNGLNPNGYIDNVSFAGGPHFDVTFTETSTGSGVWEANLNIDNTILSGSNMYTVGIGTENYTVSTTGTSDDFDLQVLIIDENNILTDEFANSILLQFNEI